MKSLARQDVSQDRSYATSPIQQQRPSFQGDSYRNVERPSQKQSYVMDNKENNFYKYQQIQTHQQHKLGGQIRPNSSNMVAEKQQTNPPRTFSSNYDKRDKKDQNVHPQGYMSQMHVTSAPSLKKMTVDNRGGSLKKEVNTSTMKNSVLVNPSHAQNLNSSNQAYHYTNQQFSQQKSNRFFSNNPEPVQQNFLYKSDQYQSLPNDNRSKVVNLSHKPGPSSSFIESKPQSIATRKNETDGDAPKKTQDYQEYKQLQDKLQYLENKIISIKSNIDNSNSQLTKTSSRFKKDSKAKGLTAKFFGRDDKKKIGEKSDTNLQKPSDVGLNSQKPKHKQEQSNPSLSSFITQVKQASTINNQIVNPNTTNMSSTELIRRKESNSPSHLLSNTLKNLITKPESAKCSTTNQSQKKPFVRKASQDVQKYTTNTITQINKADQHQESDQFMFYVSSVIKAFMATEVTKTIEQSREHIVQTVQAIQFAKTMKPTPQQLIDEKKVFFTKREQYRNKKTLVFDLDETLIHCNESAQVPGDVYLPIRFPTGELIEASINVRPFAQQILEGLSKHFEIIVFTASHSCYANVVLDYLDPGQQWVSHRLFRESCVQTEEGAYIKDLRVLANRNLSDLVLIDNAAYSFGLQIHNGIPILPYYEDKKDQELLYLQTYLMQFKNVRDMRDLNSKSLKVDSYAEFNDPIELIQTLFKELIPLN